MPGATNFFPTIGLPIGFGTRTWAKVMDGYYLHYADGRHGPFELQEIQQMWKEAQIPPATKYWDEGAQAWRPVLELLSGSYQTAGPSVGERPRSRRFRKVIPSKRPVFLTVLAVLGILGAVLSGALSLAIPAELAGAWFPPLVFAASVVSLIAWIGIWQMRRWGVYLYIVLIAASQVLLVMTGLWEWPVLVIPLVSIGLLLFYVREMV